MDLRPYQLEMLDGIRISIRSETAGGEGLRSVCAVLSTGGGKTVIISKMAKGTSANGLTVWAVAHREELIYQISETFGFFGIHHGIIKPGVPETPAQVQVAMIQTLKNRMMRHTFPDLLIVDECHHTPSNMYAELIKLLPAKTKIIGFTATPERLDGKGLGAFYQKIVQGPSIQELISMGYLVPPEVYGPVGIDTSSLHMKMGDFARDEAAALVDESRHIGDVVENYQKFARGLSSVVFATTIEHAKHLAKQFNDAGISAAHIDGGMRREERKAILDAFRLRRVMVLSSVDLISEGFDLPTLECVILDRPTKSLGLYMQQVGRALRPAPGKKRAVIIDHVENHIRHGMPDEIRRWSLYGRKEREKEEEELEPEYKVKTCPDCFRVYREKVCPACGITDRERDGVEVERIHGELVLIERKKNYLNGDEFEQLQKVTTYAEFELLCKQFKTEEQMCRKLLVAGAKTLNDLRRVQGVLNYKPGWANHRYEARHGTEGLLEALEAERAERLRAAYQEIDVKGESQGAA